MTVTEKALRDLSPAVRRASAVGGAYCRNYGLGCTQATTEVKFDDLILRMMRVAGAVA